MSDIILKIDHLTKRFGDRVSVNDLCLDVERGDIFGFLGRNGAGKSTTIKMIMGMAWPTSGNIYVNGVPVVTGRHKGPWPVGAIIDSPIFYDHLTGRTNLDILANLTRTTTKQEIDDIVDLVGLTKRQHEKVSVYSHGMRQRLGLAQALLPQPELLILDEPLDGLDPNGIRDLRDVMLTVVKQRGITIFVSSHILAEVEVTCNRVAVIHEGRKLYQGPTKDLIQASKSVQVRTAPGRDLGEFLEKHPLVESQQAMEDGSTTIIMEHSHVPQFARDLVGHGFDVLAINPLQKRLEDVFLDITEGAGAKRGEEE